MKVDRPPRCSPSEPEITAVAVIPFNTELRVGEINHRGKPQVTEEIDQSEGVILRRGVVVDWDAYESAWSSAMYRNQSIANANVVVLSEAPLTPLAQRERTVSMLFGMFEACAVLVAVDAVLALRAFTWAEHTAIVLSSTDQITHAVPIVDGIIIPHAIVCQDLGKEDFVRSLYASDDCEPLFRPVATLTQATNIDVGDGPAIAKAAAAEEEDSDNYLGMHQIVCKAISRCQSDEIRTTLFGRIFLVGSTTSIGNFKERLESEVTELVPEGTRVSVYSEYGTKSLPYVGACALHLAASEAVLAHAFTRAQFMAEGVTGVHGHVLGISFELLDTT